jgi:hypothetical protein
MKYEQHKRNKRAVYEKHEAMKIITLREGKTRKITMLMCLQLSKRYKGGAIILFH